jgi:chemotaxis-related protein WspB
MLYLLFDLGGDRYVIKASDVIEIVPLVKLTNIPKAPDFIAGMFNYRGTAVPVIDMHRLITNRPYSRVMSTRIILVDYSAASSPGHVLGLIAAHVTDMVNLNDKSFVDPVIQMNDMPHMSEIMTGQGGVIQRVDLENFLPEDVRKMLFTKDHKEPVSQAL